MEFDFLDPNIDDLEFAKRLTAAMEEVKKDINPDDITMNPVQFQKLVNLINFFKHEARKLGVKFESIDFNPILDRPDGVTVSFKVLDLSGEDLQKFCDVISECSAISTDVTVDDEISLSCTIPDIYSTPDD